MTRTTLLKLLPLTLACACGGGSTAHGPSVPDARETGEATQVIIDPGGSEGQEDTARIDAGPDVETVEGGFGWPCESNADCVSGYCVEGVEGPVCTMSCQEECPKDWVCRATVIGADVVSLCIPLGVDLCKPCKLDTQCGDGLCIEIGGGRYCGRNCEGHACPTGYECQTVQVGDSVSQQCVPQSGACDCTIKSDGATRPCVRKNEVGACLGFETCDAHSGWKCDAPEARAEDCNGVDDDCDGVADDDPAPPAASCEIHGDGVSAVCHGQWVCAGKEGWQCVGQKPAKEQCNYLDDDCNGKTDEPFVDLEGRYVDLHNCGACGLDCEGRIPFATKVVCDATAASPACKATECQTGYQVSAGGVCLPVISNLCAPCASDKDCGGGTDRCLDLQEGRFCGRDCSPTSPNGQECPSGYTCKDLGLGVRQCAPISGSCTCTPASAGMKRVCARTNAAGTCYGAEECDPAAGWVGCTAATPEQERCNEKDDNCNTLIDEDFPALGAVCFAGVGECRVPGKLVCRADGLDVECDAKPKQAGKEVCNGLDDDCDGATDEDWPDLGRPCVAGLGLCAEVGTYRCRSDGSGVECDAVPGPSSSEVCNYLDDDCDEKTDEDFITDGKYTAPTACGNCFTDCTKIWWSAKHHAQGVCDAGLAIPTCIYVCDPGWVDADKNPTNGCELELDPLAVYVATTDNGGTSKADCGTIASPCSTISQGIARASALGKKRVLVSEGIYAETITLANGVSVLGGYNAVTWQRAIETNVTIIWGSTVDPNVKHKKTIVGVNITSPTELSGFTIYGENNFWYKAKDTGGNSYAIYLKDCSNQLVIKDNVIYGGRGSPGADGDNGAAGANGGNGKDGGPCKDSGSNTCSNVTVAGGAGGTSTCGVAGGKGANAICPNGVNQMPPGADGSGTGGGLGGAGGYSDVVGSTSCGICSSGGKTDFGYDGGKGSNGTNGAGGAGCTANKGSVSGSEWVPGSAGSGGDGNPGGGGGGGGAGGGVDFWSVCGGNDFLGTSGGGGGAGGCGGQHGGGGNGGGASIAIFVLRTQSGPSTGPVIQGNVIYRNQGGSGGNGGMGGTGGIGGSGGVAGDIKCTSSWFRVCIGQGGTGGDGGQGGAGGGGGGGCGGASYGLLASGLSSYSGYCNSNTYSAVGDGGAGGQGGNSAGNLGSPGLAGASSNCTSL